MNMRTEPIRLPAAVVSVVLLVLIPSSTSLLNGGDWRAAGLIALGGVSVLLGGAEMARAFVDSPATKEARAEARATMPPEFY